MRIRRPFLIADWRRAWRLWSVRAAMVGAAMSGAWAALPADTRTAVPGAQWIGLILFVAVTFARIIDQPDLRR